MDQLTILQEAYDRIAKERTEIIIGELPTAQAAVNNARIGLRAATTQASNALMKDQELQQKLDATSKLIGESLEPADILHDILDITTREQVASARHLKEANDIKRRATLDLTDAETRLVTVQQRLVGVERQRDKILADMERYRQAVTST